MHLMSYFYLFFSWGTNQCQNDPCVSEKQPNQRQSSLSIITVFALRCSRASGKRSQTRWTPVGARAGSCCHSNHGGEIRAASDAVALPQ